jgi:peptide-methionine (S)-S-oxide reductase
VKQDALLQTVTLAGGCFWCVEAVFVEVDGVHAVLPGYTGGTTTSPSYREVCTGSTGHAEAVQLIFDPARISYRTILEIFFSVHDPTTANRQGPDTGTQYRSAIFYHDDQQKAIAMELIEELNRDQLFDSPVVTQVAPLDTFYPAEDYHRQYFSQHPEQAYCQAVISPKVSKLRQRWADRLKQPNSGEHTPA